MIFAPSFFARSSILAPRLRVTISSFGIGFALGSDLVSGGRINWVASCKLVRKTNNLGGALLCGSKAKLRSPSNRPKASPGGRSLNFAEMFLCVPGSTNICHPVTPAIVCNNLERPHEEISAATLS